HRKSVFVAGSAVDYAPLGQRRIEMLAWTLGKEIIQKGYNLVSGVGLGIGGAVTVGALEALFADPVAHVDERATLRPFPQRAPGLWKRYRQEMMSRAGFAIFLAGNKRKGKKVVVADGALSEFQIATERGVYPIPIGATGHAAAKIWEIVHGNLAKFFPGR